MSLQTIDGENQRQADPISKYDALRTRQSGAGQVTDSMVIPLENDIQVDDGSGYRLAPV